jgi:hypothetical protein
VGVKGGGDLQQSVWQKAKRSGALVRGLFGDERSSRSSRSRSRSSGGTYYGGRPRGTAAAS